ncbi:hypothetical protein C900_05319 [Fulvivirga imtechensis AK7]|uniref:DUF3667 domain-containing protein n=1 Tax=Fulvivirga imtechensis AK7 TaxID=1237149 RepID=L8JM16_9BACT|nr:DUF3667 domain-containing protein [Fulvivirga imtechensis]ELR69248.1 hypothetical protein C900_05319 [Fulvivirga imtechensis AK7]
MVKISEVTCVNCGMQSGSNFCGNCGQKTAVKQLKWGTLFGELNQRVLGMDNKFVKTIRDLTIRPEQVISSFIGGNRVKYIGPIGYYFILITVYVLIVSIFKIDMIRFTQGTKELMTPLGADMEEGVGLQRFIMGHMKVLSFMIMPFFVAANYLLFLKKGYNIIETAVVAFYVHAHSLNYTILAVLFFQLTDINTNYSMLVVTLLYMGFAYSRFYTGNRLWSFVKGILTYFIGLLLVMILVMIITVIVAFINPELVKSIIQLKD